MIYQPWARMQTKMQVTIKENQRIIPFRLGKTTPGVNLVRLTNQDVIYEV
jgi:hypothetical protein